MENCERPIEILLVEDNPGDVDLVKEGLDEGKICNKVHVASNGLDAMKYLRGENGEACPDLVLLDLNLPGMSGREVLHEIKSDAYLKSIPVVILTGSKQEEDICRAYGEHANCYITKPVAFNSFMQVIRSIENFWLSVVKLPCREKIARRAA